MNNEGQYSDSNVTQAFPQYQQNVKSDIFFKDKKNASSICCLKWHYLTVTSSFSIARPFANRRPVPGHLLYLLQKPWLIKCADFLKVSFAIFIGHFILH